MDENTSFLLEFKLLGNHKKASPSMATRRITIERGSLAMSTRSKRRLSL
jgi:hypothetical protein